MARSKRELSLYNEAYYREHREELKERQRLRYQMKKDEINAKAKEKRKIEKENKLKKDRENGIWDF